ncbi:MAG TPA: hypothetical protein VHE35_08205 [Kofleriaceae bacterium]|nr:hypothetical protein [Kofleriaceae bacterium]
MSFLHPVRLAFAGTFQADVSTVNNDVRHFDNASFQPSFQEFQHGDVENGWWNPTGSGAFRLLGCKVTGAWYGDGTSAHDHAADPVVGLRVGGSDERTSGKLVDIDPQWQLASELWGLEVLLTDGHADWCGGRYRPSSFRDLWFNRNPAQSGDRAASATFQSVLEGMSWSKAALEASRALRELAAATRGDRLSIRLCTFGFQDDVTRPGFTVGTVIGAIGPYLDGEPLSFVAGRRFTPAASFSTWAGMTWFTGTIDAASHTLLLDLSNAMQLQDAAGTAIDVGKVTVGVLTDGGLRENAPVTSDGFAAIADVPYTQPGWLQATGGVFAAPLTAAQAAQAADRPLALVVTSEFNPGAVSSGAPIVGIRESEGGVLVGAEPLVLRVDGAGAASVTLHATRFGAPIADATIAIAQAGRSSQQGGGSPSDPKPPTASIPDIGVPPSACELPATVVTGPAGTATLPIHTQAPGNPRGYIDGQLYLIDYRLPGQSYQARSAFDYVCVHVRDAFTIPTDPTWADVQAIFVQYGNLYPVMSRRLVDLGNPVDVKAHARLLHFAFTRDLADPAYMPVTRDLSENKRRTIVAWLEKVMAGGDPTLEAAIASGGAGAASSRPPPRAIAPPAPGAAAAPPAGGKTTFARSLGRLGPKAGGRP